MSSVHRAIVVNVSIVYVSIVALLRITMDATTESQRLISRMVERANELHERMVSASNERERLQYAAMTLATYDAISGMVGLSRAVIDRIAQCDVNRRRRRLQRTIDSLLVPTQETSGNASVSSMTTETR